MRDFLEVKEPQIISNRFDPVAEEREAVAAYKATLAAMRDDLLQMKARIEARIGSYEQKSIVFELKAVDEAIGTFEGWGATYGNVDLQGDELQPGALADAPTQVPLLDSHDTRQVIGVAVLTDTPQGLRVTGKLNLAVARAAELYALLKQGALRGLSIGYDTVQASWRGSVRLLQKLRLWEISLTAFPANPLARVESVKGLDGSGHSLCSPGGPGGGIGKSWLPRPRTADAVFRARKGF